MKVAGIIKESIVDGPGWRMTIFTQGCPHHCEGCHNPETWDFNGGEDVKVEDIIEIYKANPLLSGITFSGGEPMAPERFSELAAIAESVHSLGGNVWAYTGYVYENLIKKFSENIDFERLLNQIDFLVDGPFILAQKNFTLKFRGSENQRILKLKGKNGYDLVEN